MLFYGKKAIVMYYQKTLRKKVDCRGTGLHTGRDVHLTLSPAPESTGILFVRKDLDNFEIEALLSNLGKARYATCLEKNGVHISTAEHLLAALYALGVDNVRVEIDAPEVPIIDGSSVPFVHLIQKAGLSEQREPRKYIVITRAISVEEEEDKRVSIFPCNEYRITYAIDFEHPVLGYQELTASIWSVEAFTEKIAPARTFTLERDIDSLKKAGLVKGGSLKNAVVISENGILNDSLRFRDEFVRHKMLDLTGDLSLLGKPIRGHIIAYRAGHDLHTRLATKITEEGDSWYLSEWIRD